jgi:hypothetical protein
MTHPDRFTAYVFIATLSVTITIYCLRGWQILGFIPGGSLWVLMLLSLGSGIAYGVQKTRR